MNLLLVHSNHKFILFDIFDISFLQIFISILVIKDLKDWMCNDKHPTPFLFSKIRKNFFNYFLIYTPFSIAERIYLEKDLIKTDEDFWKHYHIELIKNNNSVKLFFTKFFISKFFKDSELIEFTF
jgi:hypothetical protein